MTVRTAFVLAGLVAVAGCDESLTWPSGVAVVTVHVGGERVRVRLTTVEQRRAAQAAQAGGRGRPNQSPVASV
jgi:hypothetical protein